MRTGVWSARLALLKMHTGAVAAVTPEEQQMLRSHVGRLGKAETAVLLREFRSSAEELLLLTAAQRTKSLAARGPLESVVLRYVNAAWSAKALALFEYLERSTIRPEDAQKWAGSAGLRLALEYDAEEIWLWPFGGQWPFPDDDDEEDA